MDGLTSQRSHHFRNVILLKKPDRGDASRACVTARLHILDRNATQSKDRDLLLASVAQPFETGEVRL
jgi:hypothetical protein